MAMLTNSALTIPVGRRGEDGQIGADLYVPDRAAGLVVFARGSGSSRFSSRNRAVAAALHARGLGQLRPAQIVVAAPVAAASTCDELRQLADDVVCITTPEPFSAVGLWYRDFSETTDEEVRTVLRAHDQRAHIAAERP